MTVAELIEQLKQFEPDAQVHIAYNYGDHWRTIVAPAVTDIREEGVKHSSFHSMPVVDEDSEDDPVVIISA